MAFLSTVVVVGYTARDPREFAGPMFDNAELGHQSAVAGDLIGDFVDVAVSVVERLPIVHRLPLDTDLRVLVHAARWRERLGLVLLGEVHNRQGGMVAPEFDRYRAGMRRGK